MNPEPAWKVFISVGCVFFMSAFIGIVLHAKDPFVLWMASFGIMCFIASSATILFQLIQVTQD